MKQLFLSLTAALLTSIASATTYTVQVENFKFTPSLLSIHTGDTVKWVWVSGSHTTTSTNIPGGATNWDAPVDASHPSFSYKVAAAGTYTYVSTPVASTMKGTIIVQGTAGVGGAGTESPFHMCPNPAGNNLRIELAAAGPVRLVITDALGRSIKTGSYNGGTIDISTAGFANGLYAIRAVIAGREYAQSFEVAH